MLFFFIPDLIWQQPGQEGETKAATTAAVSDGSDSATPMETSSPDKKETKTETSGGGIQKKGHSPSTSSSGVGSLQLPPSEGNVATASAAGLAAAAVKAKVRRGRGVGGRRREGDDCLLLCSIWLVLRSERSSH